MKTKFRNIILAIFAFIFVGSAFFYEPTNSSALNAEDAFAQVIAVNSVSQKQNASYPVGDLTNNLWLLSFAGEGNPLDSYNLYNNYSQFDLIDQYYNTGDYSLKKYYNTVSNGRLNLSAEILTRNNDGKNIQVITLDKPREYYTEYYYYDNNQGKYIKNEQGYFSHVLLKASAGYDSYAASYGEYFPSFVDCQFVANVYNDTYSSTIPKDTDISDKIISYSYAAQLDSQNSTYYLVESSMRSMREYQLICNAFSKISSRMSTSNQDFNSDGRIDCLSMSYFNTNSKNFDVPWSALLWPHKWSVGNGAGAHKELFAATAEDFKNWGYSTTEASLMAGLTWPKLGNLKLGDFFLSDFTLTTNTPETETGWNALISNTSTQIHETGHMLGLPDLYLYNDGTGHNDANTVGKWSQMCYNPDNPSLMLSYERQKMGWVDSSNVKQITTSGTYTLSVVKGLDGNNIVSYYLQNPSDSKQKIFLEYRSQNIGLYDSECGSKSGLLLYYTYSGASEDGNAYAPAYEILVLRKTGVSVLNATLGQGESFGNTTSTATSDIIYFTSNPSTHTTVNSGIVVTVNKLTENSLTFTVQWSKLNGNSYTQSDFENVKLYNKLLSQSSTSALTNLSFKNRTSLDISDCDITNLDFLWKFNLTNIKYFNLANNKITLLGLTQTQISMLEHMDTIALNNNFINLNIIPNEYLDLPMLNFGLQRTTTDKYFANKNFAWNYYVKATDKATTTINGVALSVGKGTYNFAYPNTYDIKTNISVGSFSTNLNYTLTLIKVSTQYNSSANRYKLWTNAGTGDFVAQTISIEGINSNQLTFDYDIDLTQMGDR
ncbi:MAG: hypothetical protein IJA69_03655, partial [Clostridia bacterium]|nr:hypothetical protein [Clostridia bacterium]